MEKTTLDKFEYNKNREECTNTKYRYGQMENTILDKFKYNKNREECTNNGYRYDEIKHIISRFDKNQNQIRPRKVRIQA